MNPHRHPAPEGAKLTGLPREHRVNYGALWPSKTHYKADCTCGWSSEGDKATVIAAVRDHEDRF